MAGYYTISYDLLAGGRSRRGGGGRERTSTAGQKYHHAHPTSSTTHAPPPPPPRAPPYGVAASPFLLRPAIGVWFYFLKYIVQYSTILLRSPSVLYCCCCIYVVA